MPFGSKKEKKQPASGASYPTQAAYPVQQQAAAAPPPYNAANPGAPPAYSQYPQQAPPPAQYYNPSAPLQQTYAQNPAGQSFPQAQHVVVQGGFDAGARFDGIAQPNIPPPPPGYAPNAAQLAAMQGQNVTVTQRPSNVWTGGSDGGYTMF